MTLPLWVLIAVAIGTPILAFVGTLVGSAITRRSANELEARSRREETMRTMRWAAELACSDNDKLTLVGVAELEALYVSNLLDRDQAAFVSVALDLVVDKPADEIDEIEMAGDNPQILEDDEAPALDR